MSIQILDICLSMNLQVFIKVKYNDLIGGNWVVSAIALVFDFNYYIIFYLTIGNFLFLP